MHTLELGELQRTPTPQPPCCVNLAKYLTSLSKIDILAK